MTITNLAIHHRTTVYIMILFIIVTGSIAYVTLPRESAPDITFPFIIINSNYEGTSPSDMESLVTRPLERKLKSLTDVKNMTSTSMEGSSQIFMEFEPNVDTDTALQKVRDKVDQAKGDLPSDMNDPSIMEISSSDWPIMFVVISGEVGLVELKQIAEDLKDEIEVVRGVLTAEIVGGLEREIRVEYDQDRLTAYGLALAQVIQTVHNNNQNMPGGSLDIGEARYVMKSPAEFKSPAEIDNLVISVKNGKPIYLTDVAGIRDTFKDRTSYARLDGVESVSVRVTKRAGEHLLRIAGEIKTIVAKYQAKLPEQIKITITSDSSKDIELMVADLENNIYTGLLLVLLVIFVSLGFRNSILVSLAIPLSLLLTFFILQLLGITLNFVVLFSLILALGMLVDNSIVLVENIYRHHTIERKPLITAAMEATAEVAWPVISSTATTVVAFVPLIFWPGIMGEFMGYLPKTVIITLLASLFVAMIITPSLCVLLMKPSKREERIAEREEHNQFGFIVRSYQRLLHFTLNYRILFILMFFSLLGFSIYAYSQSGLGIEMFPDNEPSRITVDIKAPEGTNIAQTNNFTLQAEAIVTKYGNIEYITTTVGNDGLNRGQINIDMIDRELRKGPQDEGTPQDGKIYFRSSNDTMTAMRKELVAAMVGVEVKVDKEKEGPPVGAPINIEIQGDEYDILAQIADTLKDKIRDVPGVVDLTHDYNPGLPEIKVDIDKERAALLGLDAYTIGFLIKGAVNGVEIGKYREGEDEYDIIARLPEAQRADIQNILRIRIPDQDGKPIPLSSVANIVTTSGLSAIQHIDQRRVVTVSSNVAKSFNAQQVLTDVRKIAETIELPAGYLFKYTGENEEMQESQTFMFKSFMIALLLIAMVLVSQFDSVLAPFIIMTSVILSLVGVFLGLIIAQKPFGVIMTGMGVISLAGVVVNNAIVLIDYINVLRSRGKTCQEAVILAGCVRFRPVLLTAITTILGMLPMVIGVSLDFYKRKIVFGSDMSQWWGPMATSVAFGLTVATILTLFVVPCLYSLIFNFKRGRVRVAKEIPELELPSETTA